MANKTQSSTSDISAEESASALREALDGLREEFNVLKSDLSENSKETLHNIGEEVKETSEAALDASYDCIRDKPLLSVGMALGIGFIIGRILTRR